MKDTRPDMKQNLAAIQNRINIFSNRSVEPLVFFGTNNKQKQTSVGTKDRCRPRPGQGPAKARAGRGQSQGKGEDQQNQAKPDGLNNHGTTSGGAESPHLCG